MVSTSFIAIWGSDVFVNFDQIIEAFNSLKKDKSDFIFPYDGMLLDTGIENRANFLKSGDLPLLENAVSGMHK
jgi:hypothetical protein